MMLVTWTCVPPIWLAMLPQKFSAATMCDRPSPTSVRRPPCSERPRTRSHRRRATSEPRAQGRGPYGTPFRMTARFGARPSARTLEREWFPLQSVEEKRYARAWPTTSRSLVAARLRRAGQRHDRRAAGSSSRPWPAPIVRSPRPSCRRRRPGCHRAPRTGTWRSSSRSGSCTGYSAATSSPGSSSPRSSPATTITMVCVSCGAVEDFEAPQRVEQGSPTPSASSCPRPGFRAESHRLDLLGTCANCAD